MGFWIFKNEREKTLSSLRKEVGYLRRLAEQDFEDAEIMELSREVRLLREMFEPEPDTQAPAGSDFISQLPKMAGDIAGEMFGPSFQGLAEKAVAGITRDPDRMKKLMDRLGPLLQKGQQKKQNAEIPGAPGLPSEYLQGYAVQQ